jgi:hypothetical protein
MLSRRYTQTLTLFSGSFYCNFKHLAHNHKAQEQGSCTLLLKVRSVQGLTME